MRNVASHLQVPVIVFIGLFFLRCEGCRKKRYEHSCNGFDEVLAVCTDDEELNGRMAGNELHYRCANDHFCSACRSISRIRDADADSHSDSKESKENNEDKEHGSHEADRNDEIPRHNGTESEGSKEMEHDKGTGSTDKPGLDDKVLTEERHRGVV